MPKNTPTSDDVGAAVDAWFNECIHGSVLGRYTECYNHVFAARDELKRRLCLLITGEAPSAATEPTADSEPPAADAPASTKE